MEYKLSLPTEPALENEDFVIYANPNRHEIAKEILEYVTVKKNEILDQLEVPKFRKVQINIFNDHKLYLEHYRQFNPEDDSEYGIGDFAGGMINYYIGDLDLESDLHKDHGITGIAHEFIHLVYDEEIMLHQNTNERIVWLDEGLAQYLSGEHRKDKYGNMNLEEVYEYNLNSPDKELPKIEYLRVQGNKYGQLLPETGEYDGYFWAYLMIKYLGETMNKKDFLRTIRSKVLIEELEFTILQDTIDYYKAGIKAVSSR